MLKMYHPHASAGNSPEFWEENWNEASFDEALRFCEIDPLRPLFERYTRPGMIMLEGGCGLGQYVAFYASRGLQTVGLDFAQGVLVRLQKRDSGLMLCAGDVAALPFRDSSFDLYFSGGVVEHFEGGPEQPLREARRVLRPGGILLISVPYFNPLRRLLSLKQSTDRMRVTAPRTDDSEHSNNLRFWQYAFTRAEFRRMLNKAGFKVIQTQGFAILFGLYELPFIRKVVLSWERRYKTAKLQTSNESSTAISANGKGKTALISIAKRLIVSEDASVPIAGLLIRALRWACANMMMYVCVRDAGDMT